MEVEMISKDCIRPSSPTPSHMKNHYNNSLLDQFMSFAYVLMILYYPKDLASKRSLLLKQSLSETLSQFYPLAGKLGNELSIKCNDEGVLYLEAKASITLSGYLKQPDLTSLHKFFPNKSPLHAPAPGSYVNMIQETTFACGGMTIDINVLHLVMDGCALASFLKAWAGTAYESSKKYPNFDGSSIFPKYDDFPQDANIMAIWGHFIRVKKMNTRSFVFNVSVIASLKEKVISSGVENPSRVEVVSALLSKNLMAAFRFKSGKDQKPFAINHAVNVCRRMLSPFSECSMGNFVCLAHTICSQKETQLSSLVCQLKEAIVKIDSAFVKNIQGDGGIIKFYEIAKDINGAFTSPAFSISVDYVMFTSWCSFGLYGVDFGWGKPVWITCAGSYGNFEAPFMIYVVLMDGRINNEIEAWVVLDEETIVILEKDEELLEYAALNPTPLY
ncbi:stemmadenine O-acetyltransferase [Ricinus communis]|uniref:Salutaridinol 7-O-acetyltransferase, putative n=1 Tax=Ricinus communis TaxID=3988 RepID=B9SW04_RICCO|nr:stemmadenine O-acetyltransferase [Ricinus communis]EEF32228.1 Salutaridinol 7-O-acetyltransferase, putative [Ricinus communis]|eukprot:XP_025015064.1 vinorine synthase-like [Ricinus communis]